VNIAQANGIAAAANGHERRGFGIDAYPGKKPDATNGAMSTERAQEMQKGSGPGSVARDGWRKDGGRAGNT